MQENNLIIYTNNDGNIIVDAIYKDETLWLSQKGMAKVFDVKVPAISKHLKNIFEEKELNKLNDLTNMFLVFAEDEAKERHVMTMDSWINATDELLKFRRKEVLKNSRN